MIWVKISQTRLPQETNRRKRMAVEGIFASNSNVIRDSLLGFRLF